ncbi:hypothetical protein TNCV_3560771 [Trichonephila clavipes]|nr:hypothetical protein TNCV_3560771 [Trichonephila clavipes]
MGALIAIVGEVISSALLVFAPPFETTWKKKGKVYQGKVSVVQWCTDKGLIAENVECKVCKKAMCSINKDRVMAISGYVKGKESRECTSCNKVCKKES